MFFRWKDCKVHIDLVDCFVIDTIFTVCGEFITYTEREKNESDPSVMLSVLNKKSKMFYW